MEYLKVIQKFKGRLGLRVKSSKACGFAFSVCGFARGWGHSKP